MEDFSTSLLYSNLADEASKDEVREALTEAGLSRKAINDFFCQVDHFNNLIERTGLTTTFTRVNTLNADYEQEKMLKLITKKEPHYKGYNSRLTSHTLMRDFIMVKNSSYIDDGSLEVDLQAIRADSGLFTEAEINVFKALYSHIDTDRTKDIAAHIEKMKQHFEENNVQFEECEKASLIFVVFHYLKGESSKLFIGHAGVLLRQGDEGYLFIEKLNYEEPYQAIKLRSKQALSVYLMNKYDVDRNAEHARPFIMENNELLKEFKPNPNKNGLIGYDKDTRN